ncbi:MAG: stage V sporulation protein AD [Clostridiales bacterium]|nr:stage V sporulation protein AD [Clostridiales bacterium]
MAKRQGRFVLKLENKPRIIASAAVVGPKEGQGPHSADFDHCHTDDYVGQESWEMAESVIHKDAIQRAIEKAGLTPLDIDMVFAGDLLDQEIASTLGLRELNIPYVGLFGACSTMALGLGLASLMADTSAANYAIASTSSHFCSAEKQFRYPLAYGAQRSPTAQRTVTGAGAAVISSNGQKGTPYVDSILLGRIRDLGIKDAANMGAAMAPAAATTIIDFMHDTGTTADDYDLILTGDLGMVGTTLLRELMATRENMDISKVHNDCGIMIFDMEKQDVHAGASGCGCSAAILCSYILSELKKGNLKNVLFVGTGALMSPTLNQQGETIPSIAHAVLIRND